MLKTKERTDSEKNGRFQRRPEKSVFTLVRLDLVGKLIYLIIKDSIFVKDYRSKCSDCRLIDRLIGRYDRYAADSHGREIVLVHKL